MFTQEEKGYCTRYGTSLVLVDRFTDKFIETDGEWHGRYVDDYGKLQTTIFKVDFITNSKGGN